jgi:hypothetical protein
VDILRDPEVAMVKIQDPRVSKNGSRRLWFFSFIAGEEVPMETHGIIYWSHPIYPMVNHSIGVEDQFSKDPEEHTQLVEVSNMYVCLYIRIYYIYTYILQYVIVSSCVIEIFHSV